MTEAKLKTYKDCLHVRIPLLACFEMVYILSNARNYFAYIYVAVYTDINIICL